MLIKPIKTEKLHLMAQITTQQEGVKTTQGMEIQMILKVGNE